MGAALVLGVFPCLLLCLGGSGSILVVRGFKSMLLAFLSYVDGDGIFFVFVASFSLGRLS
jgi:hypothetical protein